MHSTVHTRAVEFSKGLVYVIAAFLIFLALAGCVGAPHSIDQLEAMDQVKFEGWRDRVAASVDEAAHVTTSLRPQNAQDILHLADAINALSGQPLASGAISALVKDEIYAGAIRIVMLELQAKLDESSGMEPGPHMASLLGAVAMSLKSGVTRAQLELAAKAGSGP